MLPIRCLLLELSGLGLHIRTKATSITPAHQVETARRSRPIFKATMKCKVCFLLTSYIYKVLHKSQTKNKKCQRKGAKRRKHWSIWEVKFSFILHLLKLTSDIFANWNCCLTEMTKVSSQSKIHYFLKIQKFPEICINIQFMLLTWFSCQKKEVLEKQTF